MHLALLLAMLGKRGVFFLLGVVGRSSTNRRLRCHCSPVGIQGIVGRWHEQHVFMFDANSDEKECDTGYMYKDFWFMVCGAYVAILLRDLRASAGANGTPVCSLCGREGHGPCLRKIWL